MYMHIHVHVYSKTVADYTVVADLLLEYATSSYVKSPVTGPNPTQGSCRLVYICLCLAFSLFMYIFWHQNNGTVNVCTCKIYEFTT